MRRIWIAVGIVVSALAISACSNSSSPTTTRTATTTTTVQPNATAVISSNWIAFFSGATAATRKIALLQNGTQFAQIINGQAGSAQSKSVRVKVTKVTNITKNSAQVLYNIYLGSTEALAKQQGEAVLQGGAWRVSDSSFCVLLGLEFVHSRACPTS